MITRFLSRTRARVASKKLAQDPSAENYLELARSCVTAGRLEEARTVCEEGLEVHKANAELRRLYDRACELLREDRIKELARELARAPRPALWRELSELFLRSGRIARAEQVADEWFQATGEPEALLQRALVAQERFYADRRRDDGLRAYELLDESVRSMTGDERPLRRLLDLTSRCGAWLEARTTVARLLELHPGDPSLEARFRTICAQAERAPKLDQAMRQVELTGRLVDEEPEVEREQPVVRSVRPELQSLSEEPGVRGAFYVRGGTALVQGPKGATAERMARSVRELVGSSRTAARRLGLGRALDLRIEGTFGTLLLATGEVGGAALWCEGRMNERVEQRVAQLAGACPDSKEVEA